MTTYVTTVQVQSVSLAPTAGLLDLVIQLIAWLFPAKPAPRKKSSRKQHSKKQPGRRPRLNKTQQLFALLDHSQRYGYNAVEWGAQW